MTYADVRRAGELLNMQTEHLLPKAKRSAENETAVSRSIQIVLNGALDLALKLKLKQVFHFKHQARKGESQRSVQHTRTWHTLPLHCRAEKLKCMFEVEAHSYYVNSTIGRYA